MLTSKNITPIQKVFLGILALFVTSFANADSLNSSIAIEKKTANESVKTQKKVDRFADETLTLSSEYKNTLLKIETLQNYNRQLELLIESQEKEMISIQNQMDTIDETERGVIPLMNQMITTLDKFVSLDLPFQKERREKRVNDLENMMIRADVTTSSKYRRILEAYQTEIAYGESLRSYQGVINDGGIKTQVDFMSIGRVLLAYVTLDGKKAGFYNPNSGGYELLGDEYIRGLELAIKIVKKQTAPELTKLPVPVAQGRN